MVGTIVTGVTRFGARRGRVRASLPFVFGAAIAMSGLPFLGAASAASGSARHEVYPVPPGGVFTIHGRGAGHGHGMSQWGAYGAAKKAHLSTNQILHFYYPHTTLATRATTGSIRVLLSAADASGLGYVQVAPALGLAVTPAAGKPQLLATKTSVSHKAIKGWRLRRSGSSILLREKVAGAWHAAKTLGSRATFTDTAQQIPVITPSGSISYRGAIVGEIESGAMEAVNVVNLELYVQSVVASEMPSSWPAAALQAQAVAARTYARHGINNPKTGWYDVDGDTRDQAYGGVPVETPRATKSVTATAGEIIVNHSDRAILAQYASADGGWTVSGGVPYLPAEADPYDGAVPNSAHAWTRSVSAATLQGAYPSLGTLRDIEITGRDGNGLWGGRVTAVTLVGSKASVALTGADLQARLGFSSPWFRPTPLPAAPSKLAATATGQTVTATWKAPTSVPGASAVTGYRYTVSPGAHTGKVSATVHTASVAKLAAGTYTVTVVALSKAGTGPAATATVKVASSG
jgi:SpoIID/LytB domain protein